MLCVLQSKKWCTPKGGLHIKRILMFVVRFAVRSAVALAVLCAIDCAAPITGVAIGVPPVGILSAGLFGVPGVGLFLAVKMIFT